MISTFEYTLIACPRASSLRCIGCLRYFARYTLARNLANLMRISSSTPYLRHKDRASCMRLGFFCPAIKLAWSRRKLICHCLLSGVVQSIRNTMSVMYRCCSKASRRSLWKSCRSTMSSLRISRT